MTARHGWSPPWANNYDDEGDSVGDYKKHCTDDEESVHVCVSCKESWMLPGESARMIAIAGVVAGILDAIDGIALKVTQPPADLNFKLAPGIEETTVSSIILKSM